MTEYYQQENVKIEINNEGVKSFFFYGRDGSEELGPEITMSAGLYNTGTLIAVHEAVEPTNDR